MNVNNVKSCQCHWQLLEKDHERPPALGTFRADPNSSALADTMHGGSREAKDNFPSDVP